MIRYFSLEEKHVNARNYDPAKWVPAGYEEVECQEWLQRMRHGPGPRQIREGKVEIEGWVYHFKISPNSTYVRLLRPPAVGIVIPAGRSASVGTPARDQTYGSIRADKPYRVDVGVGIGGSGHTVWVLDTKKERRRRSRMGFVEKVTTKAPKEQQ